MERFTGLLGLLVILAALGKDFLELIDHQHQPFFTILSQEAAGDEVESLWFLCKVGPQRCCCADRFGLARPVGGQCIQWVRTRSKNADIPLATIRGRHGTIC